MVVDRSNGKPKVIKGLGISREELKDFLRRKQEEGDQRPQVVKELFNPDDLSLVTETPNRMIMTKVRLRLLLASQDLTRDKPLILIFLEELNKEMINLNRQGRQELLGALQALASPEDGGERPVSLGR